VTRRQAQAAQLAAARGTGLCWAARRAAAAARNLAARDNLKIADPEGPSGQTSSPRPDHAPVPRRDSRRVGPRPLRVALRLAPRRHAAAHAAPEVLSVRAAFAGPAVKHSLQTNQLKGACSVCIEVVTIQSPDNHQTLRLQPSRSRRIAVPQFGRFLLTSTRTERKLAAAVHVCCEREVLLSPRLVTYETSAEMSAETSGARNSSGGSVGRRRRFRLSNVCVYTSCEVLIV
jgi:hypothetical protein